MTSPVSIPFKVPVVVGPTGIGKSRIAFELARGLGGEVVVADSRQVYRELDIATNKPSPEAMAEVPYHLVGVADPRGSFNAHDFVRLAGAAIEGIAGRGRLPVVEGGSVLWIQALTEGLSLGGAAPRPERRAELQAMPVEELAAILDGLDPGAAVDRRNAVRLVRAIELLEELGPPLARLRTRAAPAWEAIRIGLEAPLEAVERRLRERSLEQLRRGLVEETRRALEAGVPPEAAVLTGIGYKQAAAFLRGELAEAELPAAMLRDNRRYARYQLRWLKRDPRIRWFQAEPDPLPDILEYLKETLN